MPELAHPLSDVDHPHHRTTTLETIHPARTRPHPVYGKKGMDWVRNPGKAAYNKNYRENDIQPLESLQIGNHFNTTPGGGGREREKAKDES